MEAVRTTLESIMNNVSTTPVLYGFLAMFLTMYGPRLHPKLPPMVRDLFNNNVFRFVVILLVIYISNNNLQMALIVSIGFLLVTSIAGSLDLEEKFANEIEGYGNFNDVKEFYEEEFTSSDAEVKLKEAELALAKCEAGKKSDVSAKKVVVAPVDDASEDDASEDDASEDDAPKDDASGDDAVEDRTVKDRTVKDRTLGDKLDIAVDLLGGGTGEKIISKFTNMFRNNQPVESFDNYYPY